MFNFTKLESVDLDSGTAVLVFLDRSPEFSDFWNFRRILPLYKSHIRLYFIKATARNSIHFQFSRYPQLRIFHQGNEILSVIGTYDEVLEKCMVALSHL